MDIRYALEHFRTLKEVATYLSRQLYAFSHQVFLADSKDAGVESWVHSQGQPIQSIESSLPPPLV
jgi:hypothetical protein